MQTWQGHWMEGGPLLAVPARGFHSYALERAIIWWLHSQNTVRIQAEAEWSFAITFKDGDKHAFMVINILISLRGGGCDSLRVKTNTWLLQATGSHRSAARETHIWNSASTIHIYHWHLSSCIWISKTTMVINILGQRLDPMWVTPLASVCLSVATLEREWTA